MFNDFDSIEMLMLWPSQTVPILKLDQSMSLGWHNLRDKIYCSAIYIQVRH
jgi:hypothetical protein